MDYFLIEYSKFIIYSFTILNRVSFTDASPVLIEFAVKLKYFHL